MKPFPVYTMPGASRALSGTRVLSADAVMAQMRWDEGDDQVAEFEARHRGGERMLSLPPRRSGLDSFDLAAQRAIGVAPPCPVPRDDAAFEKPQSLVPTVKPPKPTARLHRGRANPSFPPQPHWRLPPSAA